MSESASSSVLLIGFRGSGKTTFLAAVWHLLEAQEIPSVLFAPSLQSDREHLNSIRRDWLLLQPTTRTSLRDMQTVSLNVKDRDTGIEASIVIPDFSGEVFRMQWEEREVRPDFVKLAKQSSGAVLFIHPHQLRHGARIPPQNTSISQEVGEQDRIPWKAEFAPTQVQLVDILQTYLMLADNRPTRLAIVISAWDLIIEDKITPDSWATVRLPLLSQFIAAREGALMVKYFGVSAQGGELPGEKAKLQRAQKPSERIRVTDDGKMHSDITTILRWLMTG